MLLLAALTCLTHCPTTCVLKQILIGGCCHTSGVKWGEKRVNLLRLAPNSPCMTLVIIITLLVLYHFHCHYSQILMNVASTAMVVLTCVPTLSGPILAVVGWDTDLPPMDAPVKV